MHLAERESSIILWVSTAGHLQLTVPGKVLQRVYEVSVRVPEAQRRRSRLHTWLSTSASQLPAPSEHPAFWSVENLDRAFSKATKDRDGQPFPWKLKGGCFPNSSHQSVWQCPWLFSKHSQPGFPGSSCVASDKMLPVFLPVVDLFPCLLH